MFNGTEDDTRCSVAQIKQTQTKDPELQKIIDTTRRNNSKEISTK